MKCRSNVIYAEPTRMAPRSLWVSIRCLQITPVRSWLQISTKGSGEEMSSLLGRPASATKFPAASARRLGAFLITDTMERVPDIGFGSYDRLFPSQDTMPAGGFGNLIALPLQGLARTSGNSMFIDESCSPYLDQWTFLSAIEPMARSRVDHLIEEASASAKILGVRIPLVDEDEEPWLAPPSRRQPPPAIGGPLPSAITVVQAGQSEKQRRDIAARLAAIPHAEERVIVATGRYLGEGFDDSRLDTLSYHANCLERHPRSVCRPVASSQRRQARGDHL